MSALDLANLFLRIADQLDNEGEVSGEEMMFAFDATAFRSMARIIQAEQAPEKNDDGITLN